MLELVHGESNRIYFISKALDLLKSNISKFNNICSFNTRCWIRRIRNSDNTKCFLQFANSNNADNDVNKLSYEENLYLNFVKKNEEIKKICLDNLYKLYKSELKLKTILLELISTKTKKIEVVKNIKVKKLYLCRQCC